MSKTLVGILEVAAVVGVQAIPVFGQAVAAAIGTTVITGTAVATAAVVLGEAVLNATVLRPASPKPASAETSVKTSMPARKQCLGHSRGSIALKEWS